MARLINILDWETGCMADLPNCPGRCIGIEDGVIASVADIPPDMTLRTALLDYAIGYEGERGETITVRFEVWDNGTQKDAGEWVFVVGAN